MREFWGPRRRSRPDSGNPERQVEPGKKAFWAKKRQGNSEAKRECPNGKITEYSTFVGRWLAARSQPLWGQHRREVGGLARETGVLGVCWILAPNRGANTRRALGREGGGQGSQFLVEKSERFGRSQNGVGRSQTSGPLSQRRLPPLCSNTDAEWCHSA